MKLILATIFTLAVIISAEQVYEPLKFKRSLDHPWAVSPNINRDDNGNVNTGVNVKNKGKDHEFEAGWNKVVKGPNRAKPTWNVGGTFRFKRSPDQPWAVSPHINRDDNGNVNTGVHVKNKGKDHEFEAGWNKVVRGPNKAKPTWNVGGTFRFKRSPDQPWAVSPHINRDDNGNVNTGVQVKNKGKDHEFEAGWNKVVRGPNRAKPTWNVGGTFRFKRSPDQPWAVSPHINRDDNGNVNTGVQVKNKGKDHEFEAGWNKVVRGPNRAKPTWNVGGTFRFKRSPDQPWAISPHINRDDNGNVNSGVSVKNKGKDHEFEAGWNKVVRGPNRAKPTWNVGGTFRFKRSPDQPWAVSPHINRDDTGNVNTGVQIKNKGKDHEFEAGWNKVVRGPNRAKPTWNVGGTFRFKRSPDQPWGVSPHINRDDNGNVNTGVQVKNKGKDHEFQAGWNKVVRGPNRAKPTWNVGGTFRFKRSPDQPWAVSPHINRDDNGNVNTGVQVKNKGKDHEFEAGWNKVVRGPNRAKPTWNVGGTFRFKRSPDQPWAVSPHINRDDNGNVNTGVQVKNKGKDHEFEAGWNKVVRGPNRAKPTWNVGGTFRFKRSPDQPWAISPHINRDDNGNVNSGVSVKNKGKDHEFEAGWNKVVRGPNRAKPTWNVGGTFRFKRSPDQPWAVSPHINRDDTGNVNTGVQIKNKGKDHEFEAGWNKVVRGPNRAKPTWNVGGTFRFKRSPDQPWGVSPHINRDDNGNVNTGVQVKNKGKDHEFQAGWNKVVRGPNRAKPTWNVGGTFRFKRSPDQPWGVSPHINRDDNGNVNTGVQVKNKGKDHEFQAGWNKVVRGPNRAKPTWNVGGTFRFKRSPDQPWEVSPRVNKDNNGNVDTSLETKNKG
ncbi:unnamed protein product [Psylliodes chrysocephalus]|uniref:Uncharacterized protein n=1 Tax=Psylliodes chrysocephalus TaxID=3402493 RepID=A0A9P0D1W3_9CUCU|nr:unnamed protein product [Psylliodes chrysocephala]